MTTTDLRFPRKVGYDAPVSKDIGFDSPNGAVMNRLACESKGGFFTSDAPITEARTGEPQGSPVLHRSVNPVSGFHPFDSGTEVTKPLLEHHMTEITTGTTTLAQEITPFNFHSHDVRVIECDGSPWFVATDVAESLGYKSPKDAASYLDEDEKGSAIVRTPGGDQKVTVINESGLYALVLRSRKPEARKFAKWVTSEVLPAIRKTGKYEAPAMPAKISPAQAQHLRELVQLVVETGKQSHGETWNRLHRKMKVNSYLMLHPSQFDAACEYLSGKFDGNDIASLMRKHFPALPKPEPDLSAFSLKNKRLLHCIDHLGNEVIQIVPNDSMVVAPREIPGLLLDERSGVFTTREVIEIASNANQRMASQMRNLLGN